jgi:hypothetical protein
VACVKKHDPIGASVPVFPHCSRKNGGHQEDGSGVGDVRLAFCVAQNKIARGAGANQLKRMLIRLIVVDAGWKSLDAEGNEIWLDGMASSS